MIGTRQKLLIPDATISPVWKNNPDVKIGMISYLGYPVNWPDGETFGTICLIDNKENHFSEVIQECIIELRQNLESDLAFLVNQQKLKESEQEAKKIQERFYRAFNLPIIGIAITSPEKGWLEANKGLRDMLGYSMEE